MILSPEDESLPDLMRAPFRDGWPAFQKMATYMRDAEIDLRAHVAVTKVPASFASGWDFVTVPIAHTAAYLRSIGDVERLALVTSSVPDGFMRLVVMDANVGGPSEMHVFDVAIGDPRTAPWAN